MPITRRECFNRWRRSPSFWPDAKTLFHIDAAQTFGKEVETLRTLRCDFLSISGHKIYGPKGVGSLYARRINGKRRPLTPISVGGGQESGLRPGTLPVPLIVGIGASAELAGAEYQRRRIEAAEVKERFLHELGEVEFVINGDVNRTMAHVVNLSFSGVDSEALMLAVRSMIAISNGSACTSASYLPSHVLKAMGLSDERIASAVRISWGPGVRGVPFDQLLDVIRSLSFSTV